MIAVPASAPTRSFDARPLGRLFWKEYRQQRSLWLVTLAMGLVVQLVLRVALGRFESPREMLAVVLSVPMFMSVFFLIGSSAMLFALEREERTSDWLVSLAAPPGWTLVAKFGFAIVTTLALTGAMLVWALVLTAGHPLPRFEDGPLEHSAGWQLVVVGLTFGLACAFFLAWGALGSLTSRRVVEAVPVALVWWILIVCVPMGVVAFFVGGQFNSPRYDRMMQFGLGAALLGVIAADVWLGWRWCRGRYLDATFLDDLNERLSSRLRWRTMKATRIPARVEYEFAGWRTWQRLVWQERHRESLHRGLLAIVCAVGVLLALFSLAQRDSFTFAIIGLIVPLPVAMGVLGFRFDAAGQQLRFLANRGSSPLAIWLVKQVVWLPRAFWIPVVAWGVACAAEGAFIPWGGGQWVVPHPEFDGVRHPLAVGSYLQRGRFAEVVWFVLTSYAAGQLMAMLLRPFVIAAAASLMLSGVLAGWLALMVHLDVPRWWSVGSLVVWMLLVTVWYSRHWLLERRTWPVFGRLSIGLLVPPLLVLGAVATYRWLEVPGFVLKSRWLFTLLYPHEAARRGPMFKVNGEFVDDGLAAEVERMKRPAVLDEEDAAKRLSTLMGGFNTVEQFRQNLEMAAGPPEMMMGMMGAGSPAGGAVIAEIEQPADALLANRDQLARAAFWAANESRLKEILEIAQRERCESPSHWFALGSNDPLMPQQRLLLEAAQLRSEEGRLDEALDYYCASLRLAAFWSSGHALFDHQLSDGDRQQAETLRAIVEWANHKVAANASVLPAIQRVRDELARFPSVREVVVAQHQRDVELLVHLQRNVFVHPYGPAVVLACLMPTEIARVQRVLDQQLYWRWHSYQFLELSLQQTAIHAPPLFTERVKQDTEFDRDERLRSTTPLAWMTHPTLDEKVMELIVNREAIIRVTLLAMAILEWKRVHNQMPDYLGNLAPYCVIENKHEPDRVLPVRALNDPWTGELFEYTGFGLRDIESRTDQPIGILYTAGPNSSRTSARSVSAVHSHLLDYIGGSVGGSMIRSRKGRLSLDIPPKPKR